MIIDMYDSDPLHTLATMLTPQLGRVMERAQRGRTLEEWGLNPHRADPDTPMSLDDADDYEQKIPEGLTGTVLYPIMNAVDSLAAIDILLANAVKSKPFNHHTASVLSLCRTAIECSAQAVWVMCPPERSVRRARAAGLAKIGAEHAREFHTELLKAHDNGHRTIPDETYGQSQHRQKFHDGEIAVLDNLAQEKARQYSELIRKSANWIGDNPPTHAHDLLQGIHFPTLAKQEYRVCSSFTHGHSWPIDLLGGRSTDMFAMMADAIATALVYTESALCLYEAQSTSPDSHRRFYPERLQVTINEWRELYSVLDAEASSSE
ncbi:hypothetical protein [Gordonia sp. 852002-10350_SCH5691597]|uniref:hypothetical protein n=1 Tax=Gordonia sp. 852002-10350_SCH5691597 TaxID=1834085 RepID=UPI0007EAE1F9|nr:hypothetical protein [Gordonia sp. 852002-10350_SCH5691597]OBA69004.1 hypothetical protein A5777_14620 [Gordonia sp. 852002-10350_SCH5691597]